MLEPKLITVFLVCLVGHFLWTLLEVSKEKKRRVGIKEYIDTHPWQVPLSILMSIAAYVILYDTGQLNMIGAAAAGYMGDSITKKALNMVKIK